jgi:hypothetical protein
MISQVFIGETFYFGVNIQDSIKSTAMSDLRSIGIEGISSPDSLFREQASKDIKTTLVYPDSLLSQLKKSNVSYVITANLRRNSQQKTGQIINTVERFMAFIEDKYPGFMTKVSQVGADDNEPATVLKLNYEVTEIGKPIH